MGEIVEENREQKIQNVLFSNEYCHFVEGLLEGMGKVGEEQQREILRFAITVFLTVTVREKSEGNLRRMLRPIHAGLQGKRELKEWVVGLFSEGKIVD